MTTQQKAIITGFTKMGASVEGICVAMRLRGKSVASVAKQVKVLRNEKTTTTKRSNRSLRPAKKNIHNDKNKRANKKSLSRSIQTHTGL